MKNLLIAALAASTLVAACGTSASDGDAALAPEAGTTETTVTTTTTTTRNPAVEARKSPAAAPAVARRAAPEPAKRAAFRDVTIPSGTTLQLSLETAVASDTSNVEDAVSARLTNAVVIDGRTVVPAGATVAGIVTDADDSGHVKGRARVAMDFTSLTTGGSRYSMSAAQFAQLAPATKSEDATKIGIGAGAGAIIGGILGGKKGAAQGAAVGGAGGTGVVLGTRGKEVRLANGADVSTQLTAPLTIRFAN
jgi:hypothetical protein